MGVSFLAFFFDVGGYPNGRMDGWMDVRRQSSGVSQRVGVGYDDDGRYGDGGCGRGRGGCCGDDGGGGGASSSS